MAHENWQLVKEIFADALRQKPEMRPEFLDRVCSDDKILRREVESLLTSFDSAESFMETPVAGEITEFPEAGTSRFEAGKCFGHYEIIKQIGIGGMGEVYLANDKKLDRKVAVKILNEKFSRHESNLSRFMREAKAASGLNHPNILVIHEIGEAEDTHYIVSEYVEGETLREFVRTVCGSERLNLNDSNSSTNNLQPSATAGGSNLAKILDIAIQIANALSVAHNAKLIHRDIKPENIMLRPDGLVKILDFGLAKLVAPKSHGFEFSSAKPHDTAKGVIMGTVNYMSPEQAKGGRVDEQTDIFSLGVVIYEMIAGRTPFADDSMPETFANLINREPKPLADVPDELQEIVSKMLCKNKAGRYQTMREVLKDLQSLKENPSVNKKLERRNDENKTASLTATTAANYSFTQQIKQHKSAAALVFIALLTGIAVFGYYFFFGNKPAFATEGKRTIAVLPLKPVNAENRDAAYEFGIAESLIFKLSSAKDLVVRPLSATQNYADVKKDAAAIGKEQQVDYVLASNYQIADGKIRVTSQLINVSDGAVVEVFKNEQTISNVFAVQDAVSANIGQMLLRKLNRQPNDIAAKHYTTNEEAYRLYLTGKALTAKRTRKDADKAVEYLEQAVKLDPNFALAYAGLASAHGAIANFGGDNHEQYLKQKSAVEKALAIDENLPEAYANLGEMKLNYEWDFEGAERAIKKAIELNPNSAHTMYGIYLSSMGRADEAIAEIKLAIDLQPASVLNHRLYGQFLYFARRYDEAAVQLERTLEIDPNFRTTYGWLINSYKMKGDNDKAFESFLRSPNVAKDNPEKISMWKEIYAKSGWRGVTEQRIREGQDWELPYLYAEIGDKEKAIVSLEKFFGNNQRGWQWTTLKVDPRYDLIRSDPRFEAIVNRIGLK